MIANHALHYSALCVPHSESNPAEFTAPATALAPAL